MLLMLVYITPTPVHLCREEELSDTINILCVSNSYFADGLLTWQGMDIAVNVAVRVRVV